MDVGNISKQEHHERQELCTNRPRYRQGRKLTAVKVYSVIDESRYLLIQGVPAIAVAAELETLCKGFGSIEHLQRVPDYPSVEKFCEVYQVKFHTLQSARYAKRKMDDRNFYGGVLHVCYAPELETLDDTRNKLISRNLEVSSRLQPTHSCKKDRVPTHKANIQIHNETPVCADESPVVNGQDTHEDQPTTLKEPQMAETPKTVTVVQPMKRIVYHNISKTESKRARILGPIMK